METQMKAGLWLVATFAVGTVFGMTVNGIMSTPSRNRPRAESPPPKDGARGFVAEMERLLEPRDETQRAQLRPFLEQTDRTNRAIVDGARLSMAEALDSLRTAIAPLLDSAQNRRLAEFGPKNGEHPPGLGGRPGPRDFDGRGAPPPGGPPSGGPPPDRPPPGRPPR